MSASSQATITLNKKTLVRGWALTTALSFCLGLGLNSRGGAQEDPFGLSDRKFTREETMLLNMLHSKGSVGFYLLEATRLSKEATRDLEKALFQMREIEKTYAKSKGQPDTRYLQEAELTMVHAKQSAEQTENDASKCFHTLKASIKESLVQGAIKPGK